MQLNINPGKSSASLNCDGTLLRDPMSSSSSSHSYSFQGRSRENENRDNISRKSHDIDSRSSKEKP